MLREKISGKNNKKHPPFYKNQKDKTNIRSHQGRFGLYMIKDLVCLIYK